jgi:hypothetical protein
VLCRGKLDAQINSCTSSWHGQDLKTLHSYRPVEVLHQNTITARLVQTTIPLTDTRPVLHSVRHHYSCFVATLHTRHVLCAHRRHHTEASKTPCEPSWCQLFALSAIHAPDLFRDGLLLIGPRLWTRLSLRCLVPAAESPYAWLGHVLLASGEYAADALRLTSSTGKALHTALHFPRRTVLHSP